MHYTRLLSGTTDGVLISAPSGLGMLAQATDAPVVGPWAVVGMAISVAGLFVKLYFMDRQAQRNEGVPLINAENARLKDEVSLLKQRNELIYAKALEIDSIGRDKLLLLVEDSEVIGAQVFQLLRRAGFRVRRSKTVAEGIKEFDSEPPDFLVFDLKLDDGDGELVAAHAVQSGLPCRRVAVTGTTDEARMERVRASGAAVVIKPVNADILLDALRPDPSAEHDTIHG